MRQRLWHAGLMLLIGAALCGVALGQQSEPPAESAPPADAKTDDVLRGEVLPKVYYLKDAEGNLQAVPNFGYEQFMQYWKQQQQLAQDTEPPRFSIQSLEITGTASSTAAELVAKYTIAVHSAGWVGVPLRLNSADLLEAPAYAGPGDHVLDVEPERRGHIVWIRGQADQTHEVTLRLAVAVERVGPQSRLKLSVPRSARSQLQLQIPLARAVAQVSEGTTLDAVRPLAGGKTELRLFGLDNEVELSWHPADSPVASLPPILDVTGEQVIRMRGRSVSTEAKLNVRSLGSEFDHFQVRLPPGADYIGPAEPGVSLVAVDPSAAAGKLYEVKLDEKTTGPKVIRLVTERAHNATKSDEMLQLAGFEVPGAVQQGGRIVVEVEDNWQIVWGESSNVRPIDDLGDDVRRENLAGGFEYFQPYTLAARVVVQTTRKRVEPEYVVLVGSDEAQLQARLKYTIRGAKVRSLGVELPGWKVDSVGPANLVDADAELAVTGESLEIPLSQATSGELELTIEAHQKIDPADGVSLELPHPEGDDVVAADVAVVSDDNIELIPRPDKSVALAPQAVRPQMKLPKRQQDPLYYRSNGSPARFAAAVNVHEQSISTAVTTRMDVGEEETTVDQRLVYQIAYQPTDHLTLSVPSGIRPEALVIMYEDRRIVPVPMRPRAAGEAETTMVRVNLPEPTIGRCELLISFKTRHQTPSTQAALRIPVPLVMPGEGQLTANELYVAPGSGVAVSYPPGEWTQETRGHPSRDAMPLALAARKAIGQVTLAVTSKQSPTENSVIIERGWIETRLTDRGRYDWVVFRLTTSQPQLQLRLPEGVDPRSLVLAIDGARVTPDATRQRELSVSLASGPDGRHILEVGYHFSAGRRPGSLKLEAPRLMAPNWVGQFYWQVIVPQYEHVVFAPAHYNEELRWVWADFYWQRQPTLDERDLEHWIGAESAGDTPRLLRQSQYAALDPSGAPSANGYLFSTVGTIEPLEISTYGRARLVLFASLPLLVLGLALIYFPALRHPAVLFALAVLVAGASFLAPRSALLLAQASVLGLALVGVAVALARILPRRPGVIVPAHGSSQAVRERSVTELYQRAPATGTPAPSTATNPLVPTSGEVES